MPSSVEELSALAEPLDNDNKVARKRALDKLATALQSSSKEDASAFWTSHHKQLLKRLSDAGERSRELAAVCVKTVLETNDAADPKLSPHPLLVGDPDLGAPLGGVSRVDLRDRGSPRRLLARRRP